MNGHSEVTVIVEVDIMNYGLYMQFLQKMGDILLTPFLASRSDLSRRARPSIVCVRLIVAFLFVRSSTVQCG